MSYKGSIRDKECQRQRQKRFYERNRDDPQYKAKRARQLREWQESNRERVSATSRTRRLMREYGLTPAEYEELFIAQNGRCAVCRTDRPRGRWKTLVVDHDHATGRVRGLLCDPCNRGLGFLQDDPRVVSALLAYLADAQAERELLADA